MSNTYTAAISATASSGKVIVRSTLDTSQVVGDPAPEIAAAKAFMDKLLAFAKTLHITETGVVIEFARGEEKT